MRVTGRDRRENEGDTVKSTNEYTDKTEEQVTVEHGRRALEYVFTGGVFVNSRACERVQNSPRESSREGSLKSSAGRGSSKRVPERVPEREHACNRVTNRFQNEDTAQLCCNRTC
jgi:hypothetical protein